ncbi:MAG: glycosyltransferase, partial [Desulfobacterales bacterium]|nr:glycosyltransferase [Desulfobacterales bacterium]
ITSAVDEKADIAASAGGRPAGKDLAEIIRAMNKARTLALSGGAAAAEAFYACRPAGKGDLAGLTVESLSPYWRMEKKEPLPLVTVIIRTMNRPEMLENALRSAATQTWPEIEALVVNDGGENVEEIVTGFRGSIPHVRYIHLETNQGRSAAANTGLERARGAYVILLDDDDYFHPGHIAMLVRTLEENPGVGAAYAAVECVRDAASDDDGPGYLFNDPYDAHRLLTENYIPMHAALFRREYVDAGLRFDETMDTYEDWDFWVRLSQKTRFKFVDQVGAAYRVYGESGFGVDGDSDRIREARAAFFEKWRHLWTTEQLVEIAGSYKYRRKYDELMGQYETRTAHLEAVEKQVAEHTRTNAALRERLEKSDEEARAVGERLQEAFQTNIDLSRQFKTVHERNDALVEDVYKLNKINKTQADELQNRARALQDRDEEVLHLHETRESLAGELEDARGIHAALEETLRERENAARDREAYIDDLHDQLKDRRDRFDALMEEQTALSGHLDRLNEKIEAQNGRINEQDRLLEEERQKSRGLWERILELENSTSWKITRPVRRVSISARTAARGVLGKALLARWWVALSLQILRTEGVRRYMERVREKLLGRPGAPVDAADAPLPNPEIETAWSPLRFPTHEEPEFSIIIPVHNKHLYTYTCLKSLAADPNPASFEIIVVDDHSDDETGEMLAAMAGVRVVNNQGERGFIHVCNLGATHARGKFLLFLNNDTIVPGGWLKTISETFAARPDAGVVGVKLIYPDGRLQEAGGIIWQDASGWNYGRLDYPDRPEYNYVREVDYCSGACLAIPRRLFNDLGMFSIEFAPAYYEDTDLAFKVRAAGKKVIYQPAVSVIHFEGVSSGTDLASGFKRFQLVNQERLLEKWGAQLQSHRVNGSKPELERDRGVGRRVLVIDAYMLVPDQDSGSLRMSNLLEILQGLDCKVSFIADNLELRPPYGPRFQQRGVEVLHSPHVWSIEEYLKANGEFFDLIIVSRADVAKKYLKMVRKHAPSALVLFDTVDLHFLREARLAELKKSAFLARAAEDRKKQELGLMEAADVTLVVSPAEKEILHEMRPDLRIEVLSNIHDIHGSAADFHQRSGILFIGSFNHPPNTDAMVYFVHEVLPLIREALPGVKTHIVGSNPTSKVKALASDDVEVAGFVPDVSGYFNQCRLSIAPLRYGAGVKGKINMSMAYGLPVAATPMAVEGMHLTDGHDVIIGEDAESLARGIVKLHQEPELWRRLSENGLKNIEEHFSRDAARKVVLNILDAGSALK